MLLNFLDEKTLPHIVYICSMTLPCSSDNTTLLIVSQYVLPSLFKQHWVRAATRMTLNIIYMLMTLKLVSQTLTCA